MNKIQAVHVGMINSYNLITGRTTIEEVIQAGIGIFAHVPDEEIDVENIEFIIYYFQDKEMFEYCAELQDYVEENYHPDGTSKEEECDCDLPEIKEYTKKMKCATCDKRIKR